MIEKYLPWLVTLFTGGSALAFLRLWLIDRGKLRLDQNAAGAKLLTEHAERMHARNIELEPFREAASKSEHNHCDCCLVMARMIVAASSDGYGDAEKAAIAHLRRHGFGHLIEGITLASDLEK